MFVVPPEEGFNGLTQLIFGLEAIEPTDNRGERALRPAVIVRQLSHGSKNERGAEAFAGFTSVIQTAAKEKGSSIIGTLQNLFCSKSPKAPTDAHPPPGQTGRSR